MINMVIGALFSWIWIYDSSKSTLCFFQNRASKMHRIILPQFTDTNITICKIRRKIYESNRDSSQDR